MKIVIFHLFILFTTIQTFSQVGIGTTNPQARLDIVASQQEDPEITDGLLIPRINSFGDNPSVNQDGMLVFANGIDPSIPRGFYYWNNPTMSWIGLTQNWGNHDFYEEGFARAPDAISDDKYTFGNIAIGKNTATWPLEIQRSTGGRGINVLLDGTSDISSYAIYNTVSATGDGAQLGISNIVSGTGGGNKYGSWNYIPESAGGTHYALYGYALKAGSYAGFFIGDVGVSGRLKFTATNVATSTAGTGVIEIGDNLRLGRNEIVTNTGETLYIQNASNVYTYINGTTMYIDGPNQRVGLGVLAPAYRLQLFNNSAAKPTSASWTVPSDTRLKKDLKPFKDGLEMLKKIDPVWFTYNGKAGMPNETGVGTLAQDFQKIAPYMVSTWEYKPDKDATPEEYLAIDYGPLSFVMVNAIKEQQNLIDQQAKELALLKKELLLIKGMIGGKK